MENESSLFFFILIFLINSISFQIQTYYGHDKNKNIPSAICAFIAEYGGGLSIFNFFGN